MKRGRMKRRDRPSPSRYDHATGIEGETEPGSNGRVLRNLRSIKRKRDMDRAEYDALLRAYEDSLNNITAETRFTAAMLCAMHRSWLSDIYEWAGHYRTVDMSKGGFQFPPAHMIEANMAAFEAATLREHTPCTAAGLPTVTWHIARVYAELLLIHPFREGNGRLARWLSDLMTLQAGLPVPDYGFTGRGSSTQRTRYLTAVMRSYVQDYDLLEDFFAAVIERRLADLT